MPALEHRLTWLRHVVPLPLLEVSHFLGSCVGMALLLLTHLVQLISLGGKRTVSR